MKKNNELMVSVIITYYNQKEFIEKSLFSVLCQKTNFNFEILCGDNESSDGTFEILQNWQKKYPEIIKIFVTKRNKTFSSIKNVSYNRWSLLKEAKGKYIAFLDGDDNFSNINKLQIQVDSLECNEECCCCTHPITFIWNNKKRVFGKLSNKDIIINAKTYWLLTWTHSECFLFRNVYKNKEYLINKYFFDDNVIVAYFIKYGKILYIPTSMCDYNQISNSIWNTKNDFERALINISVFEEVKKIFPKLKITNFFRFQNSFKILYKNRNKIGINKDREIANHMYIETVGYANKSVFGKMLFLLKYFGLAYCDILFKPIKKVILKILSF